jgi:hypothetical protein
LHYSNERNNQFRYSLIKRKFTYGKKDLLVRSQIIQLINKIHCWRQWNN